MCLEDYSLFQFKKKVILCLLDQNESATKNALNEGGWLNTGDIGWIAPSHSLGRSRRCSGVVVLEGRAKDTIVLSTGNLDTSINSPSKDFSCCLFMASSFFPFLIHYLCHFIKQSFS